MKKSVFKMILKLLLNKFIILINFYINLFFIKKNQIFRGLIFSKYVNIKIKLWCDIKNTGLL